MDYRAYTFKTSPVRGDGGGFNALAQWRTYARAAQRKYHDRNRPLRTTNGSTAWNVWVYVQVGARKKNVILRNGLC
jgi:hypothetical protein